MVQANLKDFNDPSLSSTQYLAKVDAILKTLPFPGESSLVHVGK